MRDLKGRIRMLPRGLPFGKKKIGTRKNKDISLVNKNSPFDFIRPNQNSQG